MNFRTEIKLQRAPLEISHRSKIFMAGSCFSENICQKLSEAKFDVCGNPFGVLFNPASIASMLYSLAARRIYTHADLCSGGRIIKKEDLPDAGGLWFSWDHHGSFSGIDKERVLAAIRRAAARGADALEQADTVIITFGTAWIYRLAESGDTDAESSCRAACNSAQGRDNRGGDAGRGRVVANCHKMPAEMFVRERMSAEEIVALYTPLLEGILGDKRVVFTVSPVRHLKDGFEENSLSKAILRVAVGELAARFEGACYLPAFEMMNDDLRDYRFYAEDMLHPSPKAVDYIWEKFCGWALNAGSLEVLPKCEKLSAAMKHRIIDHGNEGSALFARRMLSLVDELSAALPEVDFSRERDYFLSLPGHI